MVLFRLANRYGFMHNSNNSPSQFKIEWSVILPFWWVALISSYLWQTIHCYYPPDIGIGVSGWMFYDANLISTKLFMGGTFEDMCLFHPIGLMFGVLLALYVFKIFKPTQKKRPLLKVVTFSLIVLYLLITAIFLDNSSLMSFLIFAIPGIITMRFCYNHININRFIVWFLSMLLFTFIWDFTSVVATEMIWDEYARCWFYIRDELHSLMYSRNQWAWILGKLPIAIDINYPASGMIFLTGVTGYFKYGRD